MTGDQQHETLFLEGRDGDRRQIKRRRSLDDRTPNESDVYKTRMRYRDKVCFEKNVETKKPRQAQRGSRKKHL